METVVVIVATLFAIIPIWKYYRPRIDTIEHDSCLDVYLHYSSYEGCRNEHRKYIHLFRIGKRGKK